MGADGGFCIAKIKDVEAAKALEACAVGKQTNDCGIVSLWEMPVYIAGYGTNMHGIPDLDCLNPGPDRKVKLTEEILLGMLGIYPYNEWEKKSYSNDASRYLINLSNLGIVTNKDLWSTWQRAIDWSTIRSFETWT